MLTKEDLRARDGAIEVNVLREPDLPTTVSQRHPTTSRDATSGQSSLTKVAKDRSIEYDITHPTVKMVYDWDSAKEETCYRMYIEEKRSLEEIMEYYKSQNFTPRYGLRCGLRPLLYSKDVMACIPRDVLSTVITVYTPVGANVV